MILSRYVCRPLIVHHLTPVGALCPACKGTALVPESVTVGRGVAVKWRECRFCLAVVDGKLMSTGVVHKRRLECTTR